MKYLVVLCIVALVGCPAPLTSGQKAVDTAFGADQEMCYQTSGTAKAYVACVDKMQRCSLSTSDPLAYMACKDGGVPQ